MAEQGRWRWRLLKLVLSVPLVLLAILAFYSLASLTDGSLADLSVPVVTAVVVALLAVLLLSRWLFTRRAKRRLARHATPSFTAHEIRTPSWPPNKVTPPPARPTLTPTVASKWGSAGTPSVSRGPRMPVARAAQPDKEVVSAAKHPGESSAFAEYLSGREELATLIANVEARLPGAPEAVEGSPPAPVAAANAAPRAPSDDSAAQNAQALSEAVDKVTRASELIAQSCALFTEAVEADRAELRALAEAVMTLAQAIVPPPSTPRLVGGNVFAAPTRARERDIVVDDDRSDTPVPAASVPADQPGPAAPRPAAATPRPSNWSAAQTTSPPTSLHPMPRFPGNRSGS